MEEGFINRIDHIVYCVKDLQSGIAHIADLTGAQPSHGGRHLTKGTHNAILKIGKDCYLEILAPDPLNKVVSKPRWMGIDFLNDPKITRWAIKTSDIKRDAAILTNHSDKKVLISSGSRQLENGTQLKWQLTDPGTEPEVDVLPFLLDWKDSPHPTKTLIQECSILELQLFHRDSHPYNQLFSDLNCNLKIEKSIHPKIQITLQTPKGLIQL